MRIGIVGSEEAKFSVDGRGQVFSFLYDILQPVDVVVSGGCHLGGVDIWAEEAADVVGCEKLIFPPASLSWSEGYKPRNIQIAEHSDHVICLVVDRLPPDYTGMTFPKCYHCNTTDHVKSGGCWTVKYAKKIGIPGEVIVVRN